VTDTLLDNNLIGVRYKSSGAQQEARGALDHVTILGNSTVAGSNGVLISGGVTSLTLNNSTIVNHKISIKIGGGNLFTFGNNRVFDNVTEGAPNNTATPFE
jgi:hypothetical protein